MTKKERLIKKLSFVSADEKDDIIAFFSKYPVYENCIDWNNKLLTYNDFKTVFEKADNSKKNIKKKTRKNPEELFKNYNCRIVGKTEAVIIVMPLDRQCAVFLNSFNCGGSGAKWCIGHNRNFNHWNYYVSEDYVFYFLYFIKPHPIFGRKIIILYNNKSENFYTWDEKDEYCCSFLMPLYFLSEKKLPYTINIRKNKNIHVFSNNTYKIITDKEKIFYGLIMVKNNLIKLLIRLGIIKPVVLKDKIYYLDSLIKLFETIFNIIMYDVINIQKQSQPIIYKEPIRLEIGNEFALFVNKDKGVKIIKNVKEIRHKIALEYGKVIPNVRIIDDPSLEDFEYNILIYEEIEGKGKINCENKNNNIDDFINYSIPKITAHLSEVIISNLDKL